MNEVEIKLAFAPDNADQIQEKLISWLGQPNKTEILDNRYFDTPDQALRKTKWSLRIRTAPDYIEQTVKGKGQVRAGLHSRIEKNWPLAEASLDPAKLAEIAELQAIDLTNLAEAFRTVFERKTWLIKDAAGQIELVLDQGRIETANGQIRIAEVELEIKEGDVANLLSCAEQVVSKVPCWLFSESKAYRGYRLADGGDAYVADPNWQNLRDAIQWVDRAGAWLNHAIYERNMQNPAIVRQQYIELLNALAGIVDHKVVLREAVDNAISDAGLDQSQNILQYLEKSHWLGKLGLACIISKGA